MDEILQAAYTLLSRAADHAVFADFVERILAIETDARETFYHTLNTIHNGAVLVQTELSKGGQNTKTVLGDLTRYGEIHEIMRMLVRLSERYTDLERIDLAPVITSSYSGHGLLQTLADLEATFAVQPPYDEDSPHSDLDNILVLVLRHGSFERYLRSESGFSATTVVQTLTIGGFNPAFFVGTPLRADVLTRQETSIVSWEENFDQLIADFKTNKYNVLFSRPPKEGKTKATFDHALKSKVCGYSSSQLQSPQALDKVMALLYYCKSRQAEQTSAGKKIDEPLVELEERLENLRTQIEFGGRPTGGKLYSRTWNRTLEDFSREDIMLCCACLGGEKQDLTFKALYNPAYVYLDHFIEGIPSPLGFSILNAGFVGSTPVLLSVSPYEANPALRTALGEKNTYLYVLDAMVKAASDANAEYLLLDDIDLLVRDVYGVVVKSTKDGIKSKGEPGYETGEPVVIQYRNGEMCAPRKFKRFMERVLTKYSAVTHEDIKFKQVGGDQELVEEQFGAVLSSQHYSIQSVRPLHDPSIDYGNISPELSKQIFDRGYAPQNGVRTVFRINVREYIKLRLELDKVDLVAAGSSSVHGVKVEKHALSVQ
ncbi:hypothetical protein HZC07_04015 [Candidatus Micrarchaeota archaeon]|nr:hypothetical protein [Candidatus Micrarchaeota archaeon]